MVSGITLTRKSLTVLILLSILIPLGYGMGLAWWMKKIPESPLDARVRLDAMWVPGKGDGASKRLIPSVSVLNPTAEPWKNLTVGLNKVSKGMNNQFYASEPKGIAPGGTVSIPLEAFVARNGSVKFPVGSRKVREVTVFAQVGTGARAVAEFELPESLQASPPLKADPDAQAQSEIRPPVDASWVLPSGNRRP
jgi:hypothetical protein